MVLMDLPRRAAPFSKWGTAPEPSGEHPLLGDVRGIAHFTPSSLSELRSALVHLAFQLDRLPVRVQRVEAERILSYLEQTVADGAPQTSSLSAAWREKLAKLVARHRVA